MLVFNWKGHLLTGFAGAGGIILFSEHILQDRSLWIMVMMILLGSLLPDIDHPQSKLGRYNPAAYFMKHRGWTHTFLGVMLLASPFVLFAPASFLGIALGGLIHVMGDYVSSFFVRSAFRLRFWVNANGGQIALVLAMIALFFNLGSDGDGRFITWGMYLFSLSSIGAGVAGALIQRCYILSSIALVLAMVTTFFPLHILL